MQRPGLSLVYASCPRDLSQLPDVPGPLLSPESALAEMGKVCSIHSLVPAHAVFQGNMAPMS